MAYYETKVYFDGSHYIAIPYKANPTAKKGGEMKELALDEKKEAFEKAYKEIRGKWKKKADKLVAELAPHFESEEKATEYVMTNLERKKRNFTVRCTRLARKINIGEWNYFCTFTYDDKKHTEESFKKKLQNCFKKMCYRKGWAYIGVWERSPQNNRLHFHGLFYIPENAMVGDLIEHRDYSTKARKMQTTMQNTYFNERFGRSDFKPLDIRELDDAKAYLMKYIEKTGERIVYSKNSFTYFYSDILDDDVICTIGQENRKLLLFDDFSCFDNGVCIGEVSRETINQMRKTN
jgi:hypothetical protein